MIAHAEIGLLAVNDPKRHVVAPLVNLRGALTGKHHPTLAAAVGDVWRWFVGSGDVMLEVAFPGVRNKRAGKSLPILWTQGERFVELLRGKIKGAIVLKGDLQVAHVHRAMVEIFGMGLMIRWKVLLVVPAVNPEARTVYAARP